MRDWSPGARKSTSQPEKRCCFKDGVRRGRLNTDTKETEYDGSGDCVDTDGDKEERRRRCINSHHGQKTENLDFFFFSFQEKKRNFNL